MCGDELREVFRYPVCRRCLAEPQPLSAEFFCSSCRTPFQNAFPLDAEGRCALCRSGVRGFDAAYSFGGYDGGLRKLLHLYKYARIRTLAKPLGEMLVRAMPRDERFDAIVPVPLYWVRQWTRGFNQSGLLAGELSRRTGVPVMKALRRMKSTRTQAGLSNHARRQNVARAFRSRPVEGKRILLVDDVLTTGSTATACALVLKRAGAERVAVLTLARADRRIPGGSLEPVDSNLGGSSE